MGFADVWNRTLVYFGIAEEEDDWDEDGYQTNEELERGYRDRDRRTSAGSRRAGASASSTTGPTAPARRTSAPPRRARPARLRSVDSAPSLAAAAAASVRVHLVLPRSFNDAQQVADKFKEGIPVILNLQGSDAELSKRLIDFSSGLTYALNGGMQRVADKVFLLTPRNVEVSAEERARLLERGGFFNQA